MSRRLFILLLPALALLIWLAAAQIPLWTAPQPNWFAPGTPGVCAAVESLRRYGAERADVGGIGAAGARAAAAEIVAAHYDAQASAFGEPLAVWASVPGDERRAIYVVTAQIGEAASVIYVDAASGEARALLTTSEDPAQGCEFSVRAALVAAVKSPPALLLAAYLFFAAAGFSVRWLLQRRRRG